MKPFLFVIFATPLFWPVTASAQLSVLISADSVARTSSCCRNSSERVASRSIRICASSYSLSSGEVLPSFNALAGIDFESLLLDTNGRFGRPT